MTIRVTMSRPPEGPDRHEKPGVGQARAGRAPSPLTDRDTPTRHRSARRIALPSVRGGTLVIDQDGPPPAWFPPVVDTIGKLLLLPPNWDSYGAYPVDPQSAGAALELLAQLMASDTPAPDVIPTNRGGIQLGRHMPTVDLGVSVLPSGQFRVSYENYQTGREWEGELTSDLTRLSNYLAELAPLK